MQKEKGWDVDARLLMYAAGLQMGSSMCPPSSPGTPPTSAALATAAVPPAEIALWRNPEGDKALNPSASFLSLRHSASRQSLVSAVGFGGDGDGNNGGSGAAASVVVTPEELRMHGIDRVRIVPQVGVSYTQLRHIKWPQVGLGEEKFLSTRWWLLRGAVEAKHLLCADGATRRHHCQGLA